MPTLAHDVIEQQIANIVRAMGSSASEAQTVAHNLVLSNLKGHDSHGVGMIPRYVEAFIEGSLKLNQSVKVNSDLGSLLYWMPNKDMGKWQERKPCAWGSSVQNGMAVASYL